MKLFDVLFESPVRSFSAYLLNTGPDIEQRSGVLGFRVYDSDGVEIPAPVLGLPVSSHLGTGFMYVPATASGSHLKLADLRSDHPMARLEIEYHPIFTKTPLQDSQIGIMSFTTGGDVGDGKTAVSKVHFAWPIQAPSPARLDCD